jgi:hypothetical protein
MGNELRQTTDRHGPTRTDTDTHGRKPLLSVFVRVCLCLSVLLQLGALAARAQQIPDLTLSQTLGVDESDYFFLGPTGMKGWMWWSSLTADARQILVTEVRSGTPADGVMEYHDVILGIGGNMFTNDARVAFVNALIDAEATGNNGELYLTVFRPSTAQTTTKMIPLAEMGTFSATTPYNCPKVDATVSNFCEYIYENGPVGQPTELPSVWAMLASGDDKYIGWATNYIMNQTFATWDDRNVYKDTGQKVWYTGYQGITLAQYYLMSSNAAALPALYNIAEFIARGQDLHGLWGHTMAWPSRNGGELHGTLPGYGALNQSGLVGLYALVLAQKCGLNDPEVDAAVLRATHFFRAHMYIGAINYGYHPPVAGVVDSNGRMGIAAHVFRALGDHEAAKWFTMMTSTYGWRDWGHTGNEFNHCWGPMAADIGGPDLASWLQSTDHYRVSLAVRRQPEGNFQSQGQQGQGGGRSNGHATGGYGVQLAANRSHIEITGAGYDTNLYWLTSAEMDDVIFAQKYEGGSSSPSGLSTAALLDNLDTFSPKVAHKIADVLKGRWPSDLDLYTNLVGIVEDVGQEQHERVAALRALGVSNAVVKSTTDTWFAPARGPVLNWGAANFAAKDTQTVTNMLAAITQFDPNYGFDMLTASTYSQKIYSMDPALLDANGSNLYYEAAGVILDPSVGGSWWINSQDVKNWDPLILANYADKIIRTAEQYAMTYDAMTILEHNQIGEGLHSVLVRSSEYWVHYGPSVTPSYLNEYGEHWAVYSNYTHSIKSHYAHNQGYSEEKSIVDFTIYDSVPPVQWFRNLIATNIVNAVTNPVTLLADLRASMAVGKDQDLLHAVTLDEIVSHPGNTDPFHDITNSVGFIAPVVGAHWRLYKGAVELGIADTNSTSRWMTSLAEAGSNDNDRVIGGILHVLAGKGATQALASARGYLYDANDSVAMAALDVIAELGSTNELLMVFDNYMTNSVTAEAGVFKNDFWDYANWEAIKSIIDRDYVGSLALSDEMASRFNTFTSNGSSVGAVPYRSFARAPSFPILSPALTEREILGFGNGIYSVLGLFARDNTNCRDALITVHNNHNDSYYGRGHDFTACESILKNYTIAEIVAIENAGGTNAWNERGAFYYLVDRMLSEQIPVDQQLDVFEVRNGKFQDGGSFYYYGTTWQKELNYRRGLEETDGVHFFHIK